MLNKGELFHSPIRKLMSGCWAQICGINDTSRSVPLR